MSEAHFIIGDQKKAIDQKIKHLKRFLGEHGEIPIDPFEVELVLQKLIQGRIGSRDIFPVTVNYSMSLEKMIEAGCYDLVRKEITREEFPKSSSEKERTEMMLVNFSEKISTEKALRLFDKHGLYLANIEELLAFGAAYQDRQRKFHIVALGSISNQCAPYLSELNDDRRLSLSWIDADWPIITRFLVRT